MKATSPQPGAESRASPGGRPARPAASAARVLVADDAPDVIEALALLLKSEGMQVATARTPAELLATVEREAFDAVIMDLNYARDTTSGREGLDLLARLRGADATLPVVVMTAWGTVEGAVEALQRGARDYIQKPWDNARLLATLRAQIALGGALRRSRVLESESERRRRAELPDLVAESRAMAPVLHIMERVAPSDANVLITGEHGTGKEVVARWLHAASGRAARAFVPVNASALGEGVLESELFGHERGSFTGAVADRIGCFELADGGTLFLDEIGTMPAAQQAKLLRVLETGELARVGSSRVRQVDVRVLSATNAELARGGFREDLLYRLNTVTIHVPPLRERREDIPRLAGAFLAAAAARGGGAVTGFDAGARQALLDHRWPGNVRELRHAVDRAVLLARGAVIGVEDLGLHARDGAPDLEELTLAEVERHLIQRALAQADGNVSSAAQKLGLSRSALYRRLQRHGLGNGVDEEG